MNNFTKALLTKYLYKEGIEKGKLEEQIAINLMDILDDKTISLKVGLEVKEVKKLRKKHL